MSPDKIQSQFNMLTPFNDGEVKYITQGKLLINATGVYLYATEEGDRKQMSSIASKLKEVGVDSKQIILKSNG